MTKKLNVKLNDTVDRMVASLKEVAEQNNVSLEGIRISNFNTFLDDAFNDGGEVRCERFADLAWDYAFQFGELESIQFMNAQWKCILKAINKLA